MSDRTTASALLRLARLTAPAAALMLAGCLNFPDGPTTCSDGSPNAPDWPYCAPSEPGGHSPVDDGLDPT